MDGLYTIIFWRLRHNSGIAQRIKFVRIADVLQPLAEEAAAAAAAAAAQRQRGMFAPH